MNRIPVENKIYLNKRAKPILKSSNSENDQMWLKIESNLKKKVMNEKIYSALNSSCIEKMSEILSLITKIPQDVVTQVWKEEVELEKDKEKEKGISKGIQTDMKNSSMEKLEEENSFLQEELMEYKKKYKVNKAELEDYKRKYLEICPRYDDLQGRYDKLSQELDLLKIDYEALKQNYNTANNLYADKEEYIKALEDNLYTNREMEESSFTSPSRAVKMNNIDGIIDHGKLHLVTKYLDIHDIFNLKHSSKKMYLSIDTNVVILRQMFFMMVRNKNKTIEDLKMTPRHSRMDDERIDFHQECINLSLDIENLVKKYNPLQDEAFLVKSSKQLQEAIFKGIEFINNDLKVELTNSKKKSGGFGIGGM